MSDNQILYISSILCFLLIFISFKYNKQFAFTNAIMFVLYSVIFYYCLFNNGQGGSSFLWWFYLIIATSLQILIVVIYLGIKFFKK